MSDVTAGQRSRRVVSFGQVQTGGIARGLSLPARPDGNAGSVIRRQPDRQPAGADQRACRPGLRLSGAAYHRAVTFAAIWLAIFSAESAGLARHVLMSMMTLFLSANARPQ